MSLFGWCQSNHHGICKHTFTSPFGVVQVCACECHADEVGDQ